MPIPSHQNHPQAPLAKPEPSGSILSQLASNTSSNPLTPLCLDNAFPTLYPFLTWPDPTLLQPFLFLASVWFPTSTLIPNLALFDLLSSCIKHTSDISSVSRSLIAYLPRLMCPSLPFLALYISVPLLSTVCSLCLIIHYPPFVSLSHPQFPIFIHPCFIYLYSLPPSTLI